jgi:pentatricopeptide repeat protein
MLRHLENATLLNHECTNSGLFPSISCYNHVLEALVKAGSSKTARQTFHRLLKFYHDGHSTCLPNTPIFDMYLTLLAKSKSMKGVDLAEEARSVLEELLNIYEVTGSAECMPDERIFNLVLLTFTKGSSQKTVEASFALLDRMSMIGVMPNEFTINTIMSITLQAKVEDGFRKVISLIDLMEDLGLEPTTFTYRTILNACSVARDSEKEQALQQTISIMAQLTKLEDADAMLFASLAKAISTLLPRGNRRYEKLIKSTLRLAHQKGPLPPGAEKIFRSVLGKNNGKGMLNATNARRAAMQSRPRLSNA